jgi:uncharacterized protein (DUF885 family)
MRTIGRTHAARLLILGSLASLAACGDTTPPPVAPTPPPTTASAAPVATTPAEPTPPPPSPGQDAGLYRTAINEAIESYLSRSPVTATAAGDHRFDDAWPDITKEGEAQTVSDFRVRADGLREIAKVSPETVQDARIAEFGTDRPALDARVLANKLAGEAEYVVAVRPYEKDPSAVLMMIGYGMDRILAHPYAPLQTRMDAISSRLGKIPTLLATARGRLDKPRKAGLENAEMVAKGLIMLLKSDVTKVDPKTIGGDAALATRLRKNAEEAARAIDAYAKDVAKTFPSDKADEQPIGAEAWGRVAALTEGVTESPAEVKKMGEDEIVRLQGELDALMKTTGKPGETRQAFLKRMETDQPKPETVLSEYKASAARVEGWLKKTPFVTVPWDKAKLEVVETPPHMRGITFASMNVAGPLDEISDARFEVNVPNAQMPKPRMNALLSFHARGALDGVSVHEGLPGHYLQALVMRSSPSKVRKLVWTSTSGEGWAHYCEEASLLQELPAAGGDKARAMAFYLRFALQRATRVVVDVGEADGTLTLAAAAKRLETDGLLAPDAARMEARRGMVRPVNMFTYTYGKIAIKKLRDAVKAKEGSAFTPLSFHDRFLSMGAIPVKETANAAFGMR